MGRRRVQMLVVAGLTAAAFSSGAAALLYEVAWMRHLELFLGATQQAISLAVGSFMGGMLLGNLLYGRLLDRVRRPLLLFAAAEATVGLASIAVPHLIGHARWVYRFLGPDAPAWQVTFWKAVVSLGILALPTAAMGVTYPALVDAAKSVSRPGAAVSRPYAANTAGAVLGALGAGFLLFPRGGLPLAATAALGANVAGAALGLLLSTNVERTSDPAPTHHAERRDERREEWIPLHLSWDHLDLAAALGAAFLGGAAILASEVVWNRVVGLVLDGTVYGFSVILGAVLAGMASGAAVVSGRLDRGRPIGLLAFWQVAVALGLVLVVVSIPRLSQLFVTIAAGQADPRRGFAAKALVCWFLLFLPSFAAGGAFPTAVRLAEGILRPGQAAAWVSAASTLGGLSGALSAGYLLPSLGVSVSATAVTAALTSLGSASLLLWVGLVTAVVRWKRNMAELRKPLAAALAVLCLMAAVGATRPNFQMQRVVSLRYAMEDYGGRLGLRHGDRTRLVAIWEGRQFTVSLHEDESGGIRLRNNGLNEAYHTPNPPHYAKVVFALAGLGYGFQPQAETALVIGLGSGGTLEATLASKLDEVVVVELEPAVVAASRALYALLGLESHPLDDPRIRLVLDDARNYLLRRHQARRRPFDLIVSQPSHPWLSGMGALYSEEFFRLVAANLAPSGLFCQWVNLFRMDASAFSSILAALLRVFPAVHVFKWDADSAVILAGRRKLLDPRTLARHLEEPRFGRAAAEQGLDLYDFLLSYRLGPERAYVLSRGARPVTDDEPLLEMRLPWIPHSGKLSISRLIHERGLKWGLLASDLVPDADTRVLWAGLARRALDDVHEGSLSPEDAEALVRQTATRLGAEAELLLGRLALWRGAETEAIEYFRSGYERGIAEAGLELATLWEERGRVAEARQVLEALVGSPVDGRARVELAKLLVETQPHRADELVAPVLDEQPIGSALRCEALLVAAGCRATQGAAAAAAALVAEHLDCAPDSASGHHLAARLAARAGDVAGYLEHARRAVEGERLLADEYAQRALRYATSGHLEAATRLACRIWAMDLREPELTQRLAGLWEERGRYDIAAALRHREFLSTPQSRSLATRLARVLAEALLSDRKSWKDVCRFLLK